ncbi:MAG: prolipoprotein diacylglyceryl transferase [Thermoanaerobaculia bacterium]
MKPILFDLPLPFGLHLAPPAYGTFLVLGMLAAAWAAGRHGATLGLGRWDAFDLGLWLLAGGVFGAHLLHLAVEPQAYAGDGAGSVLARATDLSRGGLAYYGGLAAAFPVLWLWGRRRGLPYLDLLDVVAPLGALGLAVTRMGCFLNGCCFGAPTSLPWGVVFPPGSLAHRQQVAAGLIAPGAEALPVHPVQLYELIVALAIFAVLQARIPRRRWAGEIVVAFGLLYGGWRLVAETMRADGPRWRPGAFQATPYQWLSLLLLVATAIAWWTLQRARREPRRAGRIE